MSNKSSLKEVDKMFGLLQREKAQLEKRISDITVEIFRLQGEARVLKRQDAEEKANKKNVTETIPKGK